MKRPTNSAQTWPAPRVARWLEYTRSEFGAVDIVTESDDQYGGQVSAVTLGPLSIIAVDVQSVTGHVRQTSDTADRPPEDYFALTLLLDGLATYVIDGAARQLGKGDILVRDLTRPWAIEHKGSLKLLSVLLPYRSLLDRLGDPEALVGIRYEGKGSETALIRHLVVSALNLAKHGASHDKSIQTANLIMDALALLDRPKQCERVPVLLRRARRHIILNYANPDLSSASLSEALGVQPKTLQRAFAAVGSSSKKEIVEARLHKAQELLSNPGLNRLTMTEIAFRVGYSDPNHFTRSFRTFSGLSPLAYRKLRMP